MDFILNGNIVNVSFLQDVNFKNNDFELRLSQTVGDFVHNFLQLRDSHGLSECFPYITLSLDFRNNEFPNGEYLCELIYNDIVYESRLLELQYLEPSANGGSDIYSHVVNL